MKYQYEFQTTSVPDGIQAVLSFDDTYELSIVKNSLSYGNKQGLYEIAVLKHGDFVEMPGITDEGESIKGFLTESDIDAIILKMVSITGKDPVQI